MSDQEIAAPVSRNSPCPCRSGKRYKDCHGAIGAPPLASDTGAAEPAPRVAIAHSRYRAPGTEWAHLQHNEQDALGALMEQALGLQQKGRLGRAAGLYREVLLTAPDTHDALHMLGVIEYGLRNFDVALELIVKASHLRPPYEAIETNLALVRGSLSEQKHSFNEQLAERALPALCELVNSRAGRPEPRGHPDSHRHGLHLIGRAHAAMQDDAWILSQLAKVLAPLRPTVWVADAESSLAEVPKGWNAIDHRSGSYPRNGTHVFVGIDFRVDEWVRQANPHRVVVVCNRGSPSAYIRQLRAMSLDGLRVIEAVFMSRNRSERFGEGRRVIPVPKTDASQPAGEKRTHRPGVSPPECVIGLIGQTSDQVEEPEDAQDLAHVAAAAGCLAIYDPGRYRFSLGVSPLIRFVAPSERTLEEFIASVDCLYWRIAPWWDEGVGREMLTAMELGKPVICPRASLHSELVDHRVDGWLFDTPEELLALVEELRTSPLLTQALGGAAQAKARRLMNEAAELGRYEALTGARVNTLAGASNAR